MPEPVDVRTDVPPKLVVSPVSPSLTPNHDGDSARFDLPLGALIPGAVAWEENVRLAGVNAAELDTTEGKYAQAQVQNWLSGHLSGKLEIWGREKYGRLLADYVADNGARLSTFVAGLPGSKPMAVLAQLAHPH